MKALIIILTIAAFLQTTIIPVDIVLLILLCRAYIKSEKANYYLAFGFGLIVSYLHLTTLGFQSLIYLFAVIVTESLSKTRLAGNPLLIIPISLAFLTLDQFINSVIGQSIIDFPKIIVASVLSLPTLYLVRIWEERFIIRKEIKLKI